MSFNLNQIIKKSEPNQYKKRIKLLKNEKGFDTSNIEDVVEEVSKNIFKEALFDSNLYTKNRIHLMGARVVF